MKELNAWNPQRLIGLSPLLCFLYLFTTSLAALQFARSLLLSDVFFPAAAGEINGAAALSAGSSSSVSRHPTLTEHDGVPSLWHSMSDEELMRRAAEVPCDDDEERRRRRRDEAKVAFMFLTRGRIPLRRLWERFFGGHGGLFSIYIHAPPEFKEEPPEDSVFYGRRIPSKAVQWGRWSMLDAERRLLANALLDRRNERFVLLSESCIPLFDFPTVRAYLLGSPLSFVSSFDDPRVAGRGRYNPRMLPAVALADWRKGSQWFELHRRLAAAVVADRRYYPVFREHCRPPCYLDEHYLATLLTKLFPTLTANRSVTWVDWSRGGSHPASFRRRDVSAALLQRMRGGPGCAHGAVNASTSTCFLFARKFEASTLVPLLRLAAAAKSLNWP